MTWSSTESGDVDPRVSDEYLFEWLADEGCKQGADMTIETLNQLALHWYGNRLESSYQSRSAAEIQAIFAKLELSGAFWKLV